MPMIALTNHCTFFSPSIHLPTINKKNSTSILPTRPPGRVFSHSHSLKVEANAKELEEEDEEPISSHKVRILKQKMKILGINCLHESCFPGRYLHLLCPKCGGGNSMERSLSLHIIQDGEFAMWRCYRTDCGWAGQAFSDSRITVDGVNRVFRVNSSKEFTAEGIALEPLGDKLIAYFGERMISKGTLRRNSVMQMSYDQAVIAFTYRQKGALVGCKYRTIKKKFWQEKGTEKWLYGLDDITEATEIIIVEGEIDKLSVEEAGFRNCVSVPGGAPKIVSAKDLPSLEKVELWTETRNFIDHFFVVKFIEPFLFQNEM